MKERSLSSQRLNKTPYSFTWRKKQKNHFLLMRKRVKYAITVLMPEKYKRNAAYVTTKIVNGLTQRKV